MKTVSSGHFFFSLLPPPTPPSEHRYPFILVFLFMTLGSRWRNPEIYRNWTGSTKLPKIICLQGPCSLSHWDWERLFRTNCSHSNPMWILASTAHTSSGFPGPASGCSPTFCPEHTASSSLGLVTDFSGQVTISPTNLPNVLPLSQATWTNFGYVQSVPVPTDLSPLKKKGFPQGPWVS